MGTSERLVFLLSLQDPHTQRGDPPTPQAVDSRSWKADRRVGHLTDSPVMSICFWSLLGCSPQADGRLHALYRSDTPPTVTKGEVRGRAGLSFEWKRDWGPLVEDQERTGQ